MGKRKRGRKRGIRGEEGGNEGKRRRRKVR